MNTVNVPGVGPVNFPEGMSERDIIRAIEFDILPSIRPAAPAPVEQERQPTNIFRDVPGAIVSGVGGLGTAAGGLYGLVSGDFDNVATRAGRSIREFSRDNIMSPGLRQRQDEFEQRLQSVQDQGLGTQALEAVRGLASDPYLFGSMAVEQIPQIAASLGIGRVGGAVGQMAARRAGMEGGEQAARRGATGTAIGASTGLQTGEVANSTYDDVMRLPAETIARSPAYQDLLRTMTDQEAREALAVSAAREAAAIAAPLSAASAALLPGVERMAFAQRAQQAALSRILGGAIFEGTQEAIEEGGGRFAQNVGVRNADEDRSLGQGVGSAAATGAVLGAGIGGGFAALRGGAPQPEARGEDPDLQRALNQYLTSLNRSPAEPGSPDLDEQARVVSEVLPVTAEQFLDATPRDQAILLARAQRQVEGRLAGQNLPVLDPQGNRDPETANIRVPQSASSPSDEMISGEAGSRAQSFQFEEGRGELMDDGITQAEFFRRRAEEMARQGRPAPTLAADESLLQAARSTQVAPQGTPAEQTIRAARQARAEQDPLGAFFPLVEGYIAQHIQQNGQTAPISMPAFQAYVRERTGQVMPLSQARDILSTYNDPAPPTARSVPVEQEPAFPAINPRARVKELRPVERPASPAPGEGFVLDETGRPVAPRGATTDEDGRPLWRSRQDRLSSLSAPAPADPTGFIQGTNQPSLSPSPDGTGIDKRRVEAASPPTTPLRAGPSGFTDPRLSSLSARETEAASQPAQPAQNTEAAERARRVVEDRLDKLEKRGGKNTRDALVRVMQDGKFNSQQVYAAFMAADQIASLLPTGANHNIEFVDRLLISDRKAAQASGNVDAQEAQGERLRPTGSVNRARFQQLMREGATADQAFATVQREATEGIIRLSLAPNQLPILRETAAHEAFHVLQDYYGKYDPQFSKLMGQSFRDGMMITDVDPTIRRKLEQARFPNSKQSYWQALTSTLKNPMDASEAQAYAFGALMDASRRGTPMTGLKPAFARFVNLARQFFTRLGNKLRGDGFQTVEDVLGRVAQGDARRFDGLATPTDQDIPAGGAQLSARFPGVRPDGDHASRVSQRVPTAKKATEDAIASDLPISTDIMARDPEAFERNISLIEDYPNYVPDPALTTPQEKARAFKDHVVRNLLWLFDNTPADIRDRSRLWYTGARSLTEDLANRYGMTDSSVAGVMAVLSPQKDWFQNVSLAMRTIDIYKTKQDYRFDRKMRVKLAEIFSDDKYAELRQIVSNKTLSQLRGMNSDLRLAALAMWVRTYDQTYNSPSFASVSPEGELGDPVLTGKGAEARVAWGSMSEIGKAISVIEDGGKENVSARVGNAHKVRNFFNNIIAPNAQRGDVTIDTHAVAAGLLRPLSQKSIEVAHGLGTSPAKGMPGASSSSITGAQGLYGIYADAYRDAAAMRGVLPREMQSITWEAIRGLFSPAFKRNAKNVDAASKIWQNVRDGTITEDQAREQINELGGGISPPSWATGRSDVVDDESLGSANDQTGVSGDELPGSEVRSEGASTPRAGGRGAGRVQAERLSDQGASAPKTTARQIQLSARATNLSVPEFTNWWNGGWRGDGAQPRQSLAVNPDGSPMTFYHGTQKSFLAFGRARSGSYGQEGPFFFSPNPAFAEDYAVSAMYAGGGGERATEGQRMLPVYLSIQNVFDSTDPQRIQELLDYVDKAMDNETIDWRDIVSERTRKSYERQITDGELTENRAAGRAFRMFKTFLEANQNNWPAIETKAAQNYIRERGFDSFWVAELGSKNLAVYDPRQIKSIFNKFEEGAARSPQFSARSPLADDPSFQAVREKITGKDLDKPNVFSDGLRRFVGAMPGEKLSNALVRTTINRAAPLWMLDRLAKEKGLSLKSAGLAMEVALNNSGRVQMYLEHGPLAYDPKTGDVTIREDAPGLIDAIKGRLNVQDKEEAQAYLVSLRERDLRRNGRKGFFNLTDAEVNSTISKSEAAHPEWKEMAADIQRINKALLDFAVNTGTLDRSKADQLASMFYTPFYRQAEADAKDEDNAGSIVGPRLSESLTNVKTAFDVKAKGGEKPLGDLFENMIRNADVIMKAGMKNVAMRQAAETMEAVGLGREAKKRETGKTITYRVNGQDKHFEVDDAVLYTTLAGAPREFANGIYQTMANVAGFFRDMITAAPSFMLANLWRGKTMAYVQEGVPFYTNTFNGLKQALQASSSYKAIAAQTGFGGYTYGMGERDAAEAFEREIAGLGYGPGGMMRRAFGVLQKASEATEMAERIKLYERMKAQGMTDKEAAYQAYLLAPFSRRGMGGGWVGSSVNWLVPLVPFLNAKIQGMYRLYENEKGDSQKLWTLGLPKQMFLRGLVLMGASLALAAKNMADEPERWDNETPDLKLRYDIVYLPDGKRLLLPRAFEVGNVFGALPVFIMDAIRREDGRDMAKLLTDIGTSTFFFNPIPQAIIPILSAATNYDFFRGRALENAGDLSKLPEERVNRNTSTVARLIGEGVGLSPIRIQAVMEGYSGTIGTSVLAGFDSILAGMGLVPNKPAGAFGDPLSMPAVIAGLTGANRFYRTDDQSASRFVGDFYKIKEQVDQLNRSLTGARERQDTARIAELQGEAGIPLRLRPMVNAASRQISSVNEQMRRLEQQGLSSEELAERLKPLRERRDQVTRRVVERARELGL